MYLQAPVLEGPGHVSALVPERSLADDENRAEVSVRRDHPQTVPLDQSLLVDRQRVVALLEQRVQTVQDRRVAQVRILKEGPLALQQGTQKH